MKSIPVFLSLCFLSCNVNTIHNNRIEDKNEAEIITTRFFECLEKGDFKKTHTLFSEKFYRQTDTTKLDLMLNQAVSSCGDIEQISLPRWETTVIEGAHTSSDYIFVYSVDRKKCTTQETIALKKEEGIIRIVGYNVSINIK